MNKKVKRPVVISFFNNKGGVGKSTLSINLASAFADDYKVLIIDNDPQGNCSELLSQEQDAEIKNAYLGKEINIRKINFNALLESLELRKRTKKDLSIITGGMALLDVETILKDKPAGETVLARNLKETIKDFDFVFIDNPPSLSIFVWNALCLSNHIIIPFKPGRSEFTGITNLLKIAATVRTELKHNINILGILTNMFTDTSVSSMYVADLEKSLDSNMMFENGVKATVKLMQAATFGLPVDLLFPEKEEAVVAMQDIKKEIIKKLEDEK
jgi:chromosome partitioning protein